jgi:hypothetical protein
VSRQEWLEGLTINAKVWAWSGQVGKHVPATVIAKNVWWNDDDELTEVDVEVRYDETGREFEFDVRGCAGLIATAPKFAAGIDIVEVASGQRRRVVGVRSEGYIIENPTNNNKFLIPYDEEASFRATPVFNIDDEVEVQVYGQWHPGRVLFNTDEYNIELHHGGVIVVVADKVASHIRRPAADATAELAKVRAQLAVCTQANKDLQAAAFADRHARQAAEFTVRSATASLAAKDREIAELTAARTRFATLEKENASLRMFIKDATETLNKLHERFS